MTVLCNPHPTSINHFSTCYINPFSSLNIHSPEAPDTTPAARSEAHKCVQWDLHSAGPPQNQALCHQPLAWTVHARSAPHGCLHGQEHTRHDQGLPPPHRKAAPSVWCPYSPPGYCGLMFLNVQLGRHFHKPQICLLYCCMIPVAFLGGGGCMLTNLQGLIFERAPPRPHRCALESHAQHHGPGCKRHHPDRSKCPLQKAQENGMKHWKVSRWYHERRENSWDSQPKAGKDFLTAFMIRFRGYGNVGWNSFSWGEEKTRGHVWIHWCLEFLHLWF